MAILQVFITYWDTDHHKLRAHFSLPFAQHCKKWNQRDAIWIETTIFATHKHKHLAIYKHHCSVGLCWLLQRGRVIRVPEPSRGVNPNSFSLVCIKQTEFFLSLLNLSRTNTKEKDSLLNVIQILEAQKFACRVHFILHCLQMDLTQFS